MTKLNVNDARSAALFASGLQWSNTPGRLSARWRRPARRLTGEF